MKTNNWKVQQREFRRMQVRAVRRGLAQNITSGRMFALLESIHAEPSVISAIAEIETRDRLLNETHNQTEKQGFVFDSSKYQDQIQTFRPSPVLSELAIENEPVGALFVAGMGKAESDSRQTADMQALKN